MREHLGDLMPVSMLDPIKYGDTPGDGAGITVDMQGFDSLLIGAQFGIEGDALGTQKFYVEVEHSLDNPASPGSPLSWEDCADSDLSKHVTGVNTGTLCLVDANAEAPAIYWTTYRGGRRFVRVYINEEGTNTNGTPIACFGIKGHPHAAPVAVAS